MATSFSSLSAQNIHIEIQALLDMLRMPDHVHVQDSAGMETLYRLSRRNPDRGDEDAGF
jgi:hypothetical protein